LIHVELHEGTKTYDLQWDGTIIDLFKEVSVLIYAMHQESGIDSEKLLEDLEKVYFAIYGDVQKGDE